MKISSVTAVFFSPTGNTKKIVARIAEEIAARLSAPLEHFDYTRPKSRESKRSFGETDLVVFGTPVYAGRVPNKLLPYVQGGFVGGGALVIPVVTFGNRNFDNGLRELCEELEENGFHTVAAAGGGGTPRVLGQACRGETGCGRLGEASGVCGGGCGEGG